MDDDWATEVTNALGLDPGSVDEKLILDLARVVAHQVERKAAPVSTFLVGLAAGKGGGDAAAVEGAARLVVELARSRGS